MDFSVMKLYWSSRSPFVRKVMVAAHELDIAGTITSERVVVSAVKPNTDVMAHNPLAKLPTLILDDGTALYDSRVICEYLASLKPQPRLFPANGPERWAALRQQARADGLLDTLIVWLMERAKPAEQQQAALIEGSRMKLRAVLDAMEKDAGAKDVSGLGRTHMDIGHIATGVALSYLDFRFSAENWRTGRPRLDAWHATIAKRPSMAATEHADVY
jgi:glutathione S-transferase